MTIAAPMKRMKPMSNEVSVFCAMARAITMKPDQMATVMIAEAMPMLRFESCIDVIIGCPVAGAPLVAKSLAYQACIAKATRDRAQGRSYIGS